MQPDSKAVYFPYIDGLRAIAVISVFIYHLQPTWLGGGFAGVDIFFVISGFIVSASVSGFDSRRLDQFVLFFYGAGCCGLRPLSWLVCW